MTDHFHHSDLGAVAAGHEQTAAVGARVLEQGGNAVDAACAMMFASCVAEGTLTSLGGGGFMLVAGPGIEPKMLDFFVRQPGMGPRRKLAPWASYTLDLDDKVLEFGSGPASVAVPGMAHGIVHASQAYGRLPLQAVAQPALELATEGIRLTHVQAVEHELNRDLLTHTPDGAAVYLDPQGLTYAEGALFRQPLLAADIEQVAGTAGQTFIDGDLARRLMHWSDGQGGRISAEDLRAFEVRVVAPIATQVGEVSVFTNPRPAMGGVIILRLIEAMLAGGLDLTGGRARDEHVARALVEVLRDMRPPMTVPPLDGALVDPEALGDVADEAISKLTPDVGGTFAGSPNTTHISAVDSDGMVASTTTTLGYGSGEFIPGSGTQLNNVLAEYDHTARRPAGSTVPSMMSPTLLHGPTTTVAIGSAGSDRIPQAISQILTRMWSGVPLGEAILAPRFVYDGEHLHAEPGLDAQAVAALEHDIPVTRWSAPNAYFGTSNAVAIRGGALYAQGDTRRSGVGLVLGAGDSL